MAPREPRNHHLHPPNSSATTESSFRQHVSQRPSRAILDGFSVPTALRVADFSTDMPVRVPNFRTAPGSMVRMPSVPDT